VAVSATTCGAASTSFTSEVVVDSLIERCCGLDVHQARVVACMLIGSPGKKTEKHIRSFGTMTAELAELRDWLLGHGCTHVLMESTGVYWMPVYCALEEALVIIVGNAMHLRNVPGRKTDVKDSEWLAHIVRHGLVRPSYVPPKDLRALRELLRYRRKLAHAQASERNRVIKILEAGNIKLSTVVTDVFGVSGRQMLRALIDGTSTPDQMAALAKARLRKKTDVLRLALDGRLGDEHKFLLAMQLERVESTERDMERLDEEILRRLEPYEVEFNRLKTIPGVDTIGAATIIAELGPDMSLFPSVGHAAAWAGVSPGNNETGGKSRRAPARRGNVHLTTALVQAAVSAVRKKDSYLKAKYWKLKARRGAKRAAMAIAHKILRAAYFILRDGTDYKDLGGTYLDQLAHKRLKRALVARLEGLGYSVEVKAKSAG
jgi:transposase